MRMEPPAVPEWFTRRRRRLWLVGVRAGGYGERMLRPLRTLLNYIGYDLHRIEHLGAPIDVLSLVVRNHLCRTAPEAFFILEIGANDGMSSDPVANLLRDHNLPALLVEPIPEAFQRLQDNYRDRPGIRCENCAIGDRDGVFPIWRVTGKDLPFWATQWSSFERRVVERNCRQLRVPHSIESVDVATLTLPSLLAKHQVIELGLVQIDTEGYDDQIIRLLLETELRPQVIAYEHCHLDSARRNATIDRLSSAGYRFCRVGSDTIALRDLE